MISKKGGEKLRTLRWVLFAPAGIAAYLAVMIIFVTVSNSTGRERENGIVPLLTNALAAAISSLVAIAVLPGYRSKIATLWVVLLFSVACYGNFIAGFISWPRSSGNVVVISLGGVIGCLCAKGWLRKDIVSRRLKARAQS